MSQSIKMPALGESVTEGTVTRWLKKQGETVAVDEPLLEVSTDKVDTEVPSPVAGVITQILVQEDQTVEVGAEVCIIGDSPDQPTPVAPANTQSQDQDKPTAATLPNPEIPSSVVDGESGPVVSWNYPTVPHIPPKAPAIPTPVTPVPAPLAPTPPPAAAPPTPITPSIPPAAPLAAPSAPVVPQPNAQSVPSATDTAPGGVGQAIRMPALGESVTEGTVTRWLKNIGDSVAVDEAILEVSTDKVDTEVPSAVAGVLTQILVKEDETVNVGAIVAYVGEQASSTPTPAPLPPSQPTPPTPTPAPLPPSQPQPGVTSTYVTPIVRKLATEKGVDLNQIQGSGVGGRIRKEDVLAAAQTSGALPPAPTPAAGTETSLPISPLRGMSQKMSRLRQVIAQRMLTSLQTTAQLTTVVEVDVTRLVALRARAKDRFAAQEGAKLTYLPFFVKAATEALKAHPKVNATITGEEVTYHDREDIGIAVDTERGLLVPVIRNCGDLTIAGISKKISDLANRTRDNTIGADELSGSTFTITNTGSRGALFDTPIINTPEVAILGIGAIVKRPAVIKDKDGNDTFAVRSMCYLALSYDHRLVDGADAARYLASVKTRLEEGDFAAEVGL